MLQIQATAETSAKLSLISSKTVKRTTLLIDIQNSDKSPIVKSWNNLCGGKTKHVTVSVCVDVDVDMPILC